MTNFIERAAEFANALQENNSFSGHTAHAALAELIANYRATVENGGSDLCLPYDLFDAAALLKNIASFLLPPQDFAQLDTTDAKPDIKIVHGQLATTIIMPPGNQTTIDELRAFIGATPTNNAEPPPLDEVPVSHSYVIGSRMPDGTVSDRWDDRLASAGATPIFTTKRIIAEFHPQVWVGDLTAPAEAEGPLTWDVTDHIYSMGRDAAKKLRDDQNDTDGLRDLPGVPDWIRNWPGPFYVEIEQAIDDFYSPLD